MVPVEVLALLETKGAEVTCERILHRLSYVLSNPSVSWAIARAVHTVSQNGPQELALHTELTRRLNLSTARNSLTAGELLDGLQTAAAVRCELPIKAILGRLEPVVQDLSSPDCVAALRAMNKLGVDRPRLISHVVERITSTSNPAELRLEALELLSYTTSARALPRGIMLLAEPGFPEDMTGRAVIALGRLNVFAPGFMASVKDLPATFEILRALDRLQWRPPLLQQLLPHIDPRIRPANVAFSLMRLDVWNEELFMRSLEAVNVAELPIKDLAKLLMSMCYFDVDHPKALAAFRCLMAKIDVPESGPLHSQLLTMEMAMRTTQWSIRLPQMTYGWLQRVRWADVIPAEVSTSKFQEDIWRFLEPLGFQEEVPIGPYTVDFKLDRLIVEADGAQHTYRNSDELTALTKLRTRLLTRLGLTVLQISSSTWNDLADDETKGMFLEQLLKPHVENTPQGQS
eukprot:GEMP01059802.1.p1 GENE.GEMP01059802.1~~GEMP01059802.1.p1  ORF type:complete len:459 (+),score=97.60 GEMP01059802.1:30-1406(+)